MSEREKRKEFRAEEPATLERPAQGASLRERLRAIALECAARNLCDAASRIVPGEGNAQAQVVLVGEAPGEEEDRQGRPFVGRSGRLLEQLLLTAGLDRRDLWITNTVKCRPVSWEAERARNRAPKTSEVKAWLPCLEQELRLLEPAVVVGLGAVAGRALVDAEFKITRQRGQWFHDERFGADVIITWHPAYILRQEGESYQARVAEAVSDFQAVFERLKRHE